MLYVRLDFEKYVYIWSKLRIPYEKLYTVRQFRPYVLVDIHPTEKGKKWLWSFFFFCAPLSFHLLVPVSKLTMFISSVWIAAFYFETFVKYTRNSFSQLLAWNCNRTAFVKKKQQQQKKCCISFICTGYGSCVRSLTIILSVVTSSHFFQRAERRMDVESLANLSSYS